MPLPKKKTGPRFIPFEEALKNYFKGYVVWKGRATRAEYWWMFFLNRGIEAIPFVGTAWSVAVFLPWISLSIRRFHDTDRPASWFFGTLGIMMAGIILSIHGRATNDHDFRLLGATIAGATFIICIVFMCLPSTPGKNKYGELKR